MPVSRFTSKQLQVIQQEAYREGYRDGLRDCDKPTGQKMRATYDLGEFSKPKPKRKLSAWNKFVKANSKKKIYQYANGKLKLKKMGIAFRKKKR